MELFAYKIKDNKGKLKKGFIEAADAKQAATILHSYQMTIVSIEPQKKNVFLNFTLGFGGKISGRELTVFTRLLGSMISTGLPLSDGLANIANQLENQKFKIVINSILRDVSSGTRFSLSIAKFPDIFSPVYINLVKAGEEAGNLDKVLIRLAENLEKNEEFQGKLKGAMVYPIIVALSMVVVGVLMLIAVIPKISIVYTEMGAELPLPTRIMINLSGFLTSFWWLLLLLAIPSFLSLGYFKKTPRGKRFFGELALKMPIFGKINTYTTLSLMVRTLGTLVGSGVPILVSLNVVRNIVGENELKDGLENSLLQVEKGSPLSFTLKGNPVFPSIIAQMVAIGEQTGTLDDSLLRLSTFFDQDVENRTKGLTTALEPLIIILMGVSVAGLAIAVLLPLFNLVSVVK
ncbi:MAG: type II secretion system F family protein [bacterium]|nr:type II secretion system F family protein [bacterium]